MNPCPLCQARDPRPRFALGAYRIVVCRQCHLGYTQPMPDNRTRAAVYEQPDYYTLSEARQARIERYAEQRLDLLERLLGGPGFYSVLDIGCASGVFLRSAQRRGWVVEGVEQSARLAEAARIALPGSHIYASRLEDLALPAGLYHAVCLWEVVEHNPTPVSLLRPLLGLLRPGGVLALSTPNLNSWAAWLLRERYPMFTPPEHVLYFSPTALKRLAQVLGARTLYWRSFGELLPDEAHRGVQKLFRRAPSTADGDPAGRWLLAAGRPVLGLLNRLGWGLELEWYMSPPKALRAG